jgi:F0F1-type ATP synthase assembly protein I
MEGSAHSDEPAVIAGGPVLSMKPDEPGNRPREDGRPSAFRMLRFASIGLELFSPIVGGAIGGYYLGEYFHRPWIALVMLFGGVFLGFYRLVIELRNFQRDSNRA